VQRKDLTPFPFPRYQMRDQVGSLRALVDTSGAVVKSVEYDAFGQVVSDSNPGLETYVGFAGGLQDRDTGLVRFGFRDYLPDVGRWTARDPIGIVGGGWETYVYVFNNPVNFLDPNGLEVRATYDYTTGVISVVDLDTGEFTFGTAFSGESGRPGTRRETDGIPLGAYDILRHAADPNQYRLEPLDQPYGDDLLNSLGRGTFRLHSGSVSLGCITVRKTQAAAWKRVDELIRRTTGGFVEIPSKARWLPKWPRVYELPKRYGELIVIDSAPGL